MSKKFFSYLPFLFLIIFSFLTRFYKLGYPPKVVFDETHHAFFAESYLVGRYFWDTHPPLGKLLFALAGYLAKNKSVFSCDFSLFLGKEYGNFKYLALRSVTALFGSLLVLVIYFLVRQMGFSKRVAFLSSFLILFDNAFLVQSRVILLDILMVFFIFLALYFFFLARKLKPFSKKCYIFNFLCGLAIGCASSIKWPAWGVLLIVWLVNLTFDSFISKPFKEKFIQIIFFLIIPFVLYTLFFFIHFSLLKRECPRSHYEIIVEKNYHKTQINYSEIMRKIPPGNFFNKFLITNQYMLAAAGSENYFFARSPWWSWPFMIRLVPYFYNKVGDKLSVIYFIGNPTVWGLGLLGLFGILFLLIRRVIKNKGGAEEAASVFSENLPILLTGYIIFFFFFSGVRSVPVYYYLPALAFSLIIFSIFAEKVFEMLFKTEWGVSVGYIIISILVLIGFVLTLPFTYGLPIFN